MLDVLHVAIWSMSELKAREQSHELHGGHLCRCCHYAVSPSQSHPSHSYRKQHNREQS